MIQPLDQLDMYGSVKARGLKLTPVRKAILEIFCRRNNELLKAGELFDLVRERQAKTNFSTIYRNLEILVQCGCVERVFYEGSFSYKAIAAGSGHRQHHMICTICHKTEPLPYCPVKDLEISLQKSDGFLPLDHRIEIYGHCKTCRLQKEEKSQKREIIRNIAQ